MKFLLMLVVFSCCVKAYEIDSLVQDLRKALVCVRDSSVIDYYNKEVRPLLPSGSQEPIWVSGTLPTPAFKSLMSKLDKEAVVVLSTVCVSSWVRSVQLSMDLVASLSKQVPVLCDQAQMSLKPNSQVAHYGDNVPTEEQESLGDMLSRVKDMYSNMQTLGKTSFPSGLKEALWGLQSKLAKIANQRMSEAVWCREYGSAQLSDEALDLCLNNCLTNAESLETSMFKNEKDQGLMSFYEFILNEYEKKLVRDAENLQSRIFKSKVQFASALACVLLQEKEWAAKKVAFLRVRGREGILLGSDPVETLERLGYTRIDLTQKPALSDGGNAPQQYALSAKKNPPEKGLFDLQDVLLFCKNCSFETVGSDCYTTLAVSVLSLCRGELPFRGAKQEIICSESQDVHAFLACLVRCQAQVQGCNYCLSQKDLSVAISPDLPGIMAKKKKVFFDNTSFKSIVLAWPDSISVSAGCAKAIAAVLCEVMAKDGEGFLKECAVQQPYIISGIKKVLAVPGVKKALKENGSRESVQGLLSAFD